MILSELPKGRHVASRKLILETLLLARGRSLQGNI
jgi:hypothetical protein